MKKLKFKNGVTMLELMIATMLTGLVFAVAMSIYTSSIKFMNLQGATSDPTQTAVVALEEIAKRISVCANAELVDGVLHLRCDYAPGTYNVLNTPTIEADDGYWHYILDGGALRFISNGTATPPPAAVAGGEILIPNVNVALSSIALSQAGGDGSNTAKVDIIITTATAPITEVRTSCLLGAKATR